MLVIKAWCIFNLCVYLSACTRLSISFSMFEGYLGTNYNIPVILDPWLLIKLRCGSFGSDIGTLLGCVEYNTMFLQLFNWKMRYGWLGNTKFSVVQTKQKRSCIARA